MDKVIINVPLETEQAQKIAADNDDIVCLFLDVDPYSSVFNVRLTRRTARGPASNISMRWASGDRVAGRTGQFCLGQTPVKSWLETLQGYGLKPVTVLHGNWDAQRRLCRCAADAARNAPILALCW